MNFSACSWMALTTFGMAVTGGDHRNAGGKIQETVAVHIPHFGALAMIHDKGITTRIRRGNYILISLDQGPSLRAGKIHDLHTHFLLKLDIETLQQL